MGLSWTCLKMAIMESQQEHLNPPGKSVRYENPTAELGRAIRVSQLQNLMNQATPPGLASGDAHRIHDLAPWRGSICFRLLVNLFVVRNPDAGGGHTLLLHLLQLLLLTHQIYHCR